MTRSTDRPVVGDRTEEGEPAPVRVLLVEDDLVDRMAFDRLVEREGLPYLASHATSVAEAREMLATGSFDVILTDYHLGDGTGIEVLEMVHDRPVIVITGVGNEETAVQAMRAGAYDYLIKDTGGQYLKVVPVTIENARRHHASAQRLRESEERFALAAAGANDGLWDWDLRRQRVYYSERWKAALGYSDGEVEPILSAWLDLVHPEDIELLEAQLEAHIEGKTPHFENEHRIRGRDGDYLWVQTRGLAVRDGDGRAYRLAGSQRDITDRKRAEEQLIHAALHDTLTGLPNRALFMDRLDNAVKRNRRRGEYRFGVIFLDLDRFKVINDSLGHLAGDELLQETARRLENCLREGDTVARLGGDEFAILLEDLDDEDEIHRVAERIQQEVKKPYQINDREFRTAASLGMALSTTGYDRAEDLLRDADTAMYRAKAQGRTRQVIFAPDMHTRAVALLHLENDLRRAVEHQEFEVHFQPIVDLADGRLRGFEALVRWRHHDRGLVAPGDFLPLAQETGLPRPSAGGSSASPAAA